MRSINKVIVIGNLTRDPELRTTPQGQHVCTFGVATNREWVTRDNRRLNSREFHECVAWAKLAEICAQFLKKGRLIYLEGYLKTRSWDTPEGLKKYKTEIIVQDMILLEKRQKEGAEGSEYIPQTDEAGANIDETGANAEGANMEPEAPQSIEAPAIKTPDPDEISIDTDLGLSKN